MNDSFDSEVLDPVLDPMMPGMAGFQVLRTSKAAGVDPFGVKPVELHRPVQVIQKLMT